MAILTCLPGLEVTVEVDGQRAHEYDADPEEVESRAEEMDFHPIPQTHRRRCFKAPYVLKYIEAKPGKRFIFVADMTNDHIFEWDIDPSQHLRYGCHLDGFNVGSKQVHGGSRNVKAYFITGSRAAGYKKHYFRFESLDVLEGGDGSNAEKAKKYGTLLVKLFLKVETGRMEAPSVRAGPPLIHAVHEKDLKGRAVDSKARYVRTTLTITYSTRYKQLRGLYQEGVIRRPVVVKDDVEEVIDVDEEEDKRRIKREPDENDDASQLEGIKREASTTDGGGGAQLAVSYKVRRLEDGKVEIDLTDD
ncbi:hypothetical protein QBC45DRAFT_470800 [Copromyces sp. CBS 386.78]|nr:hypothetical protein QBC45DRAFT_470800 [Copromyces sp. CBS 386.78]